MICPNCNKTYDDKINICPECEIELIEEFELTSKLDDKIEDDSKKIDENNRVINEKSTRPRAAILHEQWLVMREDEENYKKFFEDHDSEAFDKLVDRLIEHYKNKESEENDEWFITYEKNQAKIEENSKKIDENKRIINEKLEELKINAKEIKKIESRIDDYEEERKKIEQRIKEIENSS